RLRQISPNVRVEREHPRMIAAGRGFLRNLGFRQVKLQVGKIHESCGLSAKELVAGFEKRLNRLY
ncbi:MAG: hypothetical protein ORN83_03600, partial [Chthoniobacteraceae bacterium]|nr:hypothetical protein [Chthoniobacteraceae bacterium]